MTNRPRSPDQHLQVRHSKPRRKLYVCAAIGEIDLCTVPLLERALAKAEHRNVRSLVVDLSRTEFLGAAGLRTLLAAAERAQVRRRSFAVVAGPRAVRRVLEVSGVNQKITSYRSLSEAVRAFPVG
jgi:anti-sigma B factor antagonist